ncbi:hypothetical protein DFH08DRAFT_819993 [Mycena albidolilacea]|uniref:Uncharacterized protein n=1 Tax=Mycena albidolilacea TaxID=1033008 RepID=A0AAD6ZDS7_9AGAR|nr:hypothetical protein DFH08DRAFT_819993 [Mycena albidolilacea]
MTPVAILMSVDLGTAIPIELLYLMPRPMKVQTKSGLIYTAEGLLTASIAFKDDPDVEAITLFQDQEAYEADLTDDTSDLLEISALMWLDIVERVDRNESRGPYDKIPKSVDFFSVCFNLQYISQASLWSDWFRYTQYCTETFNWFWKCLPLCLGTGDGSLMNFDEIPIQDGPHFMSCKKQFRATCDHRKQFTSFELG